MVAKSNNIISQINKVSKSKVFFTKEPFVVLVNLSKTSEWSRYLPFCKRDCVLCLQKRKLRDAPVFTASALGVLVQQVAPGLGFGPRLMASEAIVLPLDDPGIIKSIFYKFPKKLLGCRRRSPRRSPSCLTCRRGICLKPVLPHHKVWTEAGFGML